MTRRETLTDAWGTPENLGSTVNSSYWEGTPCISADDLVLYFTSDRPGGSGGSDIWMAKRKTKDEDWDMPVNLGPIVNSTDWEYGVSVSADGLALFLMVVGSGSGGCDLWMTTRIGKDQDWGATVNLGPTVNSSIWEYRPSISTCLPGSGCTLYFTRRPGMDPPSTIWETKVNPIVDLNGDGIVDAADMCIMIDHWDGDNPLCDIGPMPWGDGVVDVEDIIVLAEHLFDEFPPSESVEVNEENDGGQVELESGQILVVTLESNPSTGYRWEVAASGGSTECILEQLGEAEFISSDTSDPPLVGAGGWEVFRFKPVNTGQMILKLIYHRSWEDVEPLKTFSIEVIVY
jgi:predicted secreted protein